MCLRNSKRGCFCSVSLVVLFALLSIFFALHQLHVYSSFPRWSLLHIHFTKDGLIRGKDHQLTLAPLSFVAHHNHHHGHHHHQLYYRIIACFFAFLVLINGCGVWVGIRRRVADPPGCHFLFSVAGNL
jgi:hypothetical protein